MGRMKRRDWNEREEKRRGMNSDEKTLISGFLKKTCLLYLPRGQKLTEV